MTTGSQAWGQGCYPEGPRQARWTGASWNSARTDARSCTWDEIESPQWHRLGTEQPGRALLKRPWWTWQRARWTWASSEPGNRGQPHPGLQGQHNQKVKGRDYDPLFGTHKITLTSCDEFWVPQYKVSTDKWEQVPWRATEKAGGSALVREGQFSLEDGYSGT